MELKYEKDFPKMCCYCVSSTRLEYLYSLLGIPFEFCPIREKIICHKGLTSYQFLEMIDMQFPNQETTVWGEDSRGYDCNPRLVPLGRNITQEDIKKIHDSTVDWNHTCDEFKYNESILQDLEITRRTMVNTPDRVEWEEDYVGGRLI